MSLGGGIGERSSSTIVVPDFDYNVWWELNKDVLNFITFVLAVTNSNLYKLEVKEPEKYYELFRSSFDPFAMDIQTHCNPKVYQAEADLDSYLITVDHKTYINANLMRNQMDGLIHYLKALGLEEVDFSETGPARRVILKFTTWSSNVTSPIVNALLSMFPDVEVDYVP